MGEDIFVWFLALGILTWIILIYSGMIIITKKIINYNNGIVLDPAEKGITKMSIIMFWITFVPLSIISFYFLLN